MARSEYFPRSLDYTLTLIGHGPPLDITLVTLEINYMEDMFGPFARLDVVIDDSLGLIDKFPLIGEEKILFKRKNGPADTEWEDNFYVYGCSQRKLINTRSHAIVLHAISQEGMKNSMEYVYQTFIEMKPEEIAKEAFNLIKNNKDLVTDSSEKPHTKVATGVNPLKLINEMAGEAKSSKFCSLPNGPSSYVFFETHKEFYFVPIPYFFDKGVKYEFYLNVPQEQEQFEQGKGAWPADAVLAVNFINTFDNIDTSHNGAYLNEINIVDPILKRFKMHPIEETTKYQFKYLRDFGGLKHLPSSGQKFIVGDDPLSPASASKLMTTHRRMFNTQIEEDGENYPTINYLAGRVVPGDQLNAPRQRQKFLCATLHEKANLFTNNIEITVSGVVEISAGDLVRIHLPQPTQMKEEHEKFLFLYGQEGSPTFLITACRHIYNRSNDSYRTVLSCAKESFNKNPSRMKFDNSIR